MERFQIVFDNAKNDPKAPIHFYGLFRGYLAFDTGHPFHYRVPVFFAGGDCCWISFQLNSPFKTACVSPFVAAVALRDQLCSLVQLDLHHWEVRLLGAGERVPRGLAGD